MNALTQSELIALLGTVKGATFATIVTRTVPKLKKTGNTLGTVLKVARTNVCLGFQYEAAVNRQLAREGTSADFEAKPRQWGERIPGTMLVTHKGRTYLETKVEKTLGHTYRDANGNILPDEAVQPFLPARSKGRQGTEKEILVRDYALDSIQGITVKGKEFVILQD
jgi:hypothetical protein